VDMRHKMKMRQLNVCAGWQVDVGLGEPVVVVSNAPKLAVGMRVVIATVGAIVGGEAVKKTSIGGAKSEVPRHRAAL
jgi:tRNA-binding EMAP/Myf-like protein